MSVHMIRRVFDNLGHEHLTSGQRLVMLALADCCGTEEDFCWPSLRLLQHRTQLGRRTIQRYLREMEDRGFLVTERDETEAGRSKSNVYRLTLPKEKTGPWVDGEPDQHEGEILDLAREAREKRAQGGPGTTGEGGPQAAPTTLKHQKEASGEDSSCPGGTPRGSKAQAAKRVWKAYERAYLAHRESQGRKGVARLTPARRAAIWKALDYYPVEDVMDAARGIFASEWHKGANDRETEYLDIELALRLAPRNNLEKFRDLWRETEKKPKRKSFGTYV